MVWILGIGVAVASVVLVAIARASARVQAADLRRGLLRAGVAAVMGGGALAVLVVIGMNGREFLGGPLGIGDALLLGLLAGVGVGVSYAVAAAGSIALGLLVWPGTIWARWGWLVGAGVFIVALGLGGIVGGL